MNANTAYTYRLRAVNQDGASPWSNEVGVITPPLLPSAPGGLAVTAASATQIDLAWQDNSSEETAFALFRKSGAGDWTRIAVLAPTSHATPTGAWPRRRATCTGCGPLAWWGLRLEQRGERHDGPGSAHRAGGAQRLTLPNLSGVDRYQRAGDRLRAVPRAGDGQWLLLALLPAGSGAYLDFLVDAGVTHSYRVRAVGASGPSGWSNEVRWRVPG